MVCASCCALLLRSLRAFADCAFGRALEPIVARWWANVTSRETIERNDSPYGELLPHWDKDESLQRSSSAPTCAGCFACAARPARALILKMYG